MDLDGKLQIRAGQTIAVLHAPDDLDIAAARSTADAADVVLVFAGTRVELEQRRSPILDAVDRDANVWVAFPKGGKLGTDLGRDIVRELLAAHGAETVRAVSIDAIWSGLRLRRIRQ